MTNIEPTDTQEQPDLQFAANGVRLSTRQWMVAGTIVLLAMMLIPTAWKYVAPFDLTTDFRVPYSLSDDHWTYQRLANQAVRDEQILIIGDSVVWGEYVGPHHTFSKYLNQRCGETRFANGGLNGAHPLALQGLVQYYAASVKNRQVLLHCNLLWMSSAERDLQTEKEMAFNHPSLVPQFVPRIPCYKAPTEQRMGIVFDRHVALRKWVNHLRVADFESLDVHSWTLENPGKNPLQQISLEPAQPLDQPHSQPIAWTERGIQPQDIPWIDLETSLQWQAFRATAERLRDRRNSLFVIVGPLNEHMLTDNSRARYQALTQQVHAWLDRQQIAHHNATLLPREEYGDASHPLATGYARLAQRVHDDAEFQRWIQDVE